MADLNTVLDPEDAVVMRALWDTDGWMTINDICDFIWQEGFNRNKVYRILRRLLEINFVAVKKYRGKNYYAKRVAASQYYPDLHKNPEEFLANETINIRGLECLETLRKLNEQETRIGELMRKERNQRRRR